MIPEQIFALVLFGILHWVLAGILLYDLVNRKKVRGGRKAPWALMIIFIIIIGGMLYLLFHPSFFYNDKDT